MQTRTEWMDELRQLLRDALAASAAGTAQPRMARAHGYVDGFMRALLSSGLATRAELLKIVASERERAGGPAVRVTEAGEVAA